MTRRRAVWTCLALLPMVATLGWWVWWELDWPHLPPVNANGHRWQRWGLAGDPCEDCKMIHVYDLVPLQRLDLVEWIIEHPGRNALGDEFVVLDWERPLGAYCELGDLDECVRRVRDRFEQARSRWKGTERGFDLIGSGPEAAPDPLCYDAYYHLELLLLYEPKQRLRDEPTFNGETLWEELRAMAARETHKPPCSGIWEHAAWEGARLNSPILRPQFHRLVADCDPRDEGWFFNLRLELAKAAGLRPFLECVTSERYRSANGPRDGDVTPWYSSFVSSGCTAPLRLALESCLRPGAAAHCQRLDLEYVVVVSWCPGSTQAELAALLQQYEQIPGMDPEQRANVARAKAQLEKLIRNPEDRGNETQRCPPVETPE